MSDPNIGIDPNDVWSFRPFIALRNGRKIFSSAAPGSSPYGVSAARGMTTTELSMDLLMQAIKAFVADLLVKTKEAARATEDNTIGKFLGTIAMKTGAMRANFTDTLFESTVLETSDIQARSFLSGDLVVYDLDFSKFIDRLPYIQYHITELTGRETYQHPTTLGTMPIHLTVIINYHGNEFIFLSGLFMAMEGWDFTQLDRGLEFVIEDITGVGGLI